MIPLKNITLSIFYPLHDYFPTDLFIIGFAVQNPVSKLSHKGDVPFLIIMIPLKNAALGIFYPVYDRFPTDLHIIYFSGYLIIFIFIYI